MEKITRRAMVTYWRSESSNKGLVVLNKLILAIQNHFFEKFEKYFPKNPKQKVQKRKILKKDVLKEMVSMKEVPKQKTFQKEGSY